MSKIDKNNIFLSLFSKRINKVIPTFTPPPINNRKQSKSLNDYIYEKEVLDDN